MSRNRRVTTKVGAGAITAALLVGGCGHHAPLGPPTPSGATPLGGPPMTSTPPPPPGWKLQPAVPATQQQAQDTAIGYLRRTLQELPPGTTLDATRYSGGTNSVPCKDDTSANPPEEFTTIGDLKPPPGTDTSSLVASAGDIWKRWGWYVYERDGFYKPNRFGYAPDGYSLQIEARARPGEPPSLKATSPCFPAETPRDRTPFPAILAAE
ncbi:hypothetical protein A5661_19135 [Mycobacterium asiaticum]|nr:hypothetical protein A5661_19135 [Mycobacterium asiaticum]